MDASPGSGSRRRSSTRTTSAEDQALDHIAKEAEARLAARRQARAEARDIRMRELEKQQKDAEEKQDRHFELVPNVNTRTYTPNTATNSRRGSDESTGDDTRELKKELQELEEKYKKAMVNNAQLDNEKQTYRYQVDLFKDQVEEMEESFSELQREHKDRCRDVESLKRKIKDLNLENNSLKEHIKQRDLLIEEHGLVYVSDEMNTSNPDENRNLRESDTDGTPLTNGAISAALLTPEAVDILSKLEGTLLDEKIKKFAEEKASLEENIKKLKQSLEDEKERSSLAEKYSTPRIASPKNNVHDMDILEIQRDAQKQVSDYKFKLKKAEQDITILEGSIIRLESQVKRYKAAAENSEKVEEDLKQEKRKMQRELREMQSQVEEMVTQNSHLVKRLEKMKSARNALGKQ